MKQAILFVTLINLIFLLNSCNTTDPPDDNNDQDTTSHLINWLVEDIGEYGSILRDVAIIDDDDIWAVGEIYLNDSLGQSIRYNAVHWNGNGWELKRIYYYGNCSAVEYPPLIAICAFSETNIVITNGGSIGWFDGNTVNLDCGVNSLLTGSISKIWGTLTEDLYVVGNNGNIAHYLNGIWSSMESGTDVNLRDIWGSPDRSIIWAAGFEDSYGTVFLRNTGNGFEKVLEITNPNIPHPPDQITHVFRSLWTDSADTIYLGAVGRVYAAPKNTTGYARENIWWDYVNKTELPPATNIIRGTASNDIFVGGYLQFVRHWNGASWKGYPEIEGDGTWRSMAVNHNVIIAVGENFSAGNARIALGFRIK
jgi:hypothetical protein